VPNHKFIVGQSVHYTGGPFGSANPNNVYTVTQLLPPEGGDFQYRIKSAAEQHERVAKESRLDRAAGSSMSFHYDAPAELFMPKRKKRGTRRPISYRRFATATEAIRFAIEEFPAIRTLGAWLQVGDNRFNGDEIQHLYDSGDYPRRRRR
jgi:hypothetical protein